MSDYLWTICRRRNGHLETIGYCDTAIDADRYRGEVSYVVVPPKVGRVVTDARALGRRVRVIHRDGRTNLEGTLITASRRDLTVSTDRGKAFTVPRRNVWRVEPIGWRPVAAEARDA